ncbi:hypothetical protein E9993_00885 [Labilibacter sediminis]|nr:hypothetical protein E9993_00885 [Labilibacter sediminis]
MKKILFLLIVGFCIVSCSDDTELSHVEKLPEEAVDFSIENLKLPNGAIDTFRFVIANTSLIDGEYTLAWELEGREEAVVGKEKDTVLIKAQGSYDVTLTILSDNKSGVKTKQLIQEKTFTGMSDAALELFNLLTNNAAIDGQAWVLDPTIDGFLGSGASGADKYDRWWDAPIGSKDGSEIMDDEFIFYADGSFKTITNGKTQVQNVDVLKNRNYYTVLKETQYDLNMQVDDNARNDGYKFKIVEDDSENPVAIKLSSEHVCIGYDDENVDRRYEILDDKDGDPKTIYLRIVSANENRYCRIVPKGYIPEREKPEPREVINAEDLAMLLHGGDEVNGGTWTLDASQVGHLGVVGWAKYANLLDPSKWWWHAGPNEREGDNLYDDEYTFYPDGSYKIETHGITTSMAVDAGLTAGYYTAASAGDGERAVFVDDNARTGHTYSIVTSEDEEGNKYIYIELSSTEVCIGLDDDHPGRKYEVFGYGTGDSKTLFIGCLHPNKPVYRFNKLIAK